MRSRSSRDHASETAVDRIRELLARITESTDLELEELRSPILDEADAKNANTYAVHGPDSYEDLEILASAATAVRREVARREDNVARAHDSRQILASFKREPLRVTARVPEDRLPRPSRIGGGDATRAVTASGMAIPDHDGLAEEFLSALRTFSMSPGGADGEKIRVATLHVDRPSDRSLRITDSPDAVTAAFDAAAEQHAAEQVRAITAAGGPGPLRDTDFTLPGFESTN